MNITLTVRDIAFDKTVCYWTSEPEVGEDLNTFGYIVEVSGGKEGPWTPLFNAPIYAYGFVDNVTQRGNVNCFYRVRGIGFDTSEFISNIVPVIEQKNSYISRYIAKHEDTFLKQNTGSLFLHYARKKFGVRCPACYSQAERKIIRPNCKVCFGTTYLNGYFAPTKISVDTDPNTKAVDKTEHGEVENATFPAWTSNQVIIEADDVLINLEDASIRYKVEQVSPTELFKAIIKQQLVLTKLRNDNPVHLIPVDENAFDTDEFPVFRRL